MKYNAALFFPTVKNKTEWLASISAAASAAAAAAAAETTTATARTRKEQ